MSDEKKREDFETWYRDFAKSAYDEVDFSRAFGSYNDPNTDRAYQAWQASRAAVVVSLPIDVSGGLYRLAVEDCTRCIEVAGLKVKP